MARKIKRYRADGSERILKDVAVQAGIDRAEHFANGGTLVAWNGGPRTVTKNLKRVDARRACRGRVSC